MKAHCYTALESSGPVRTVQRQPLANSSTADYIISALSRVVCCLLFHKKLQCNERALSHTAAAVVCLLCHTVQVLRASFPSSAIKSYPDVFYVEYFAASDDAPGGDLFFFDYGVVACWGLDSTQEAAVIRTIAQQASSQPVDAGDMEIDQASGQLNLLWQACGRGSVDWSAEDQERGVNCSLLQHPPQWHSLQWCSVRQAFVPRGISVM